jgi:hypothetical protein
MVVDHVGMPASNRGRFTKDNGIAEGFHNKTETLIATTQA